MGGFMVEDALLLQGTAGVIDYPGWLVAVLVVCCAADVWPRCPRWLVRAKGQRYPGAMFEHVQSMRLASCSAALQPTAHTLHAQQRSCMQPHGSHGPGVKQDPRLTRPSHTRAHARTVPLPPLPHPPSPCPSHSHASPIRTRKRLPSAPWKLHGPSSCSLPPHPFSSRAKHGWGAGTRW